jgi:hypothetical protein
VALGGQFRGGGGEFFGVIGRQHHLGAGFGKCFCGGKAQSGTGAGDQGNLAVEVVGRIHRFFTFM